jgi:hypothetical protein
VMCNGRAVDVRRRRRTPDQLAAAVRARIEGR